MIEPLSVRLLSLCVREWSSLTSFWGGPHRPGCEDHVRANADPGWPAGQVQGDGSHWGRQCSWQCGCHVARGGSTAAWWTSPWPCSPSPGTAGPREDQLHTRPLSCRALSRPLAQEAAADHRPGPALPPLLRPLRRHVQGPQLWKETLPKSPTRNSLTSTGVSRGGHFMVLLHKKIW